MSWPKQTQFQLPPQSNLSEELTTPAYTPCKHLLFTGFLILLPAMMMNLLLQPQSATANDLPPTANWFTTEGTTTTLMAGTYVLFFGSVSHDNDENGSSITYYNWYVDGSLKKSCSSCSSFGRMFILETGQTEKQVQIKLRVRDDEYNWDSRTITYTVRQKPGRTYYVKDHLGNVRVTVDENGNAIGWDDYYPFGKIMPGRSSNKANPNDLYKYNSKELDQEADLNLAYYGARMYDPEIGRWLSVDPLADAYPSFSPYNYVGNNPIITIDPNGEEIKIIYGCNDSGEDCNEFVFNGENASEGRELNNKFVNQFLDAFEFAVENGGGENLVEAATSEEFTVSLFGRSGNEDSVHLSGAVFWNPKQGLNTNGGNTTLSPTTALEHEVAHAVAFFTDPNFESRLDRSKYIPGFPNEEEKRVVTGPEQRTATALGEIGPNQKSRSSYFLVHPIRTTRSTSNNIDRAATFRYWRARYQRAKEQGKSGRRELRMMKKYSN